MLFCIHVIDDPDAVETRKALVGPHRDYTVATGVDVVMSGPLLADDRTTMIGSLIVIDIADRAAAERFVNQDPFMTGGVWRRVDINPFYWRVGAPDGLDQPGL